jgi:dipeptidase E
MGVQVRSLDVANKSLSLEAMTEAVDECDIILVSGGNTLYAVDRWEYLGLDNLLKDAALNGKVITGGSAGAICWFDGGHSDSMSPESYRLFKLNKQSKTSGTDSYSARQQLRKKSTSSFDEGPGSDDETEATEAETDSDSSSDEDCSKTNIDWEYIRVKGLGILPGLICPHYDRVQSNGLLRSSDFMMMMKRHLCEVGIGIDHFAALEINGSEFRVLSLPGQIGSVDDDEYVNAKMPGVWINYVDNDGFVHSKLCPRSGQVSDLLQSLPARHIVEDKRVKLCRKLNPPLRD